MLIRRNIELAGNPECNDRSTILLTFSKSREKSRETLIERLKENVRIFEIWIDELNCVEIYFLKLFFHNFA